VAAADGPDPDEAGPDADAGVGAGARLPSSASIGAVVAAASAGGVGTGAVSGAPLLAGVSPPPLCGPCSAVAGCESPDPLLAPWPEPDADEPPRPPIVEINAANRFADPSAALAPAPLDPFVRDGAVLAARLWRPGPWTDAIFVVMHPPG
jgi:hypothetical protein